MSAGVLELKKCRKCGAEKELEAFHRDKTRPDGRYAYCRACQASLHRARYLLVGKEKIYRDYLRDIKNKYGVSEEEYNELLAIQEGKCAICKRESKNRLCVDHCHETGEIRGLLCHGCNSALGLFKDNRELLQTAIEYLGGESSFRRRL